MTRGGLAGLSGLVLLVTACASAPPCLPVDVVVERKEERRHLRCEPVGLTTGPTDRVGIERRIVVTPEFWVRGTGGRRYEPDEPDWRAAEVGHTLTVCR